TSTLSEVPRGSTIASDSASAITRASSALMMLFTPSVTERRERRLARDGHEIVEAGRCMGADAAVLEDAVAFETFEGHPGDVIPQRERGAAGDRGVFVVVLRAFDPPVDLPDFVGLVRCDAVTVDEVHDKRD